MIRTIKQRIYVIGMLPLALLAVAAVIVNGALRIQETNETLRNAERMTAALLHAPAVDALAVGNITNFEKAVQDVIKSSPWLACVILRDATQTVLVQTGECSGAARRVSFSPVAVPPDALSDFPQTGRPVQIGSLGIVVEDDGVQRDRRQALIQLAASLILIGGVAWLIGRILKVRLIVPLQRIGWALGRLSARDYTARVPEVGHDEVTQLASAVNHTIQTTEAYTRELEYRRTDADRALQDADEANLLRGGLVRSLTDDFEGPINQIHSDLTAIAMANQDPKLRDWIKDVIAKLQDARSDFTDIIEIATSAQDPRRSAARRMTAWLDDFRTELQRLSDLDKKPIHFNVTAPGESKEVDLVGDAVVDIDGIRLKKAIVLLVRAMARYSLSNGIYLTLEMIRLSREQLHLAIHIKAFYDLRDNRISMSAEGETVQDGVLSMKLLGLSERESKWPIILWYANAFS
ncbi:MAG: HAMP domain-containing protein [Pseudomonadota bacterium]|nr:HAMP domain-containing protein [Pseudomonadota bacterium]